MNGALEKGIIDNKLKEYLIVKKTVTPVLYLLPKIHKLLVDPPCRPIVSGRDSIFNHASIFLDKVLRYFATGASSFVRDTDDFLLKLQQVRLTSNIIFASFDVVSLYTSIDIMEGVQAVHKVLTRTSYTSEGKEFLIELLMMILTCNYLSFNDSFYLQCRGTAMGAHLCQYIFGNHGAGPVFPTTLDMSYGGGGT